MNPTYNPTTWPVDAGRIRCGPPPSNRYFCTTTMCWREWDGSESHEKKLRRAARRTLARLKP